MVSLWYLFIYLFLARVVDKTGYLLCELDEIMCQI